MIAGFSVYAVNLHFNGHLGDEPTMAGVGMANMFMNLLFMSLMNGLNASLNTFVSQTKGYGDLRMCGVYLNRARIALTMMAVPLFIVLMMTKEIFGLIGFDPVASSYSQTYVNYMVLGLFFKGQMDINRRFLVSMGH